MNMPSEYDAAEDSWRAFLEALPDFARRKLQPCPPMIAHAVAALRDYNHTPTSLAKRVAADPVHILNSDGANRLMKHRLARAAGHTDQETTP